MRYGFVEDASGRGIIEQHNEVRREIALRITVLARLLRSDFDRHVGGIGITRSQWSLIAAVSRHPGSTQRHIAEMLEMSEVSAGRLIDRLVADGILERRAREDDRRARAIYRTDAADPLLQKMSTFARIWEDRMFGSLADADLEELGRLLGVVYANCSANITSE